MHCCGKDLKKGCDEKDAKSNGVVTPYSIAHKLSSFCHKSVISNQKPNAKL